jgi:hypothetical protein
MFQQQEYFMQATLNITESLQKFYWIIGSLCLVYLAIQLGFISYEKLTVDDLWLSYHTYQFKSLLPYRDFSPYKTALGYYLLLIPLEFFHGVILPLLCTKAFIAFINTLLLSLTSIWLKRFFSEKAIITSLLLLIFAQFFLNYSTEIRVDIFAYWLCLTSILLIFENKFILAGIASGLSFAVSQKALWYVIAANCALGGYWIYHAYSLKLFRQIVHYNFTILLLIILYIGFWSYFAGIHAVMNNVFYEAYLVFSMDSYDYGRLVLWQFILLNNPLYFMLLPLALLSLFIIPEQDKHRGLRILITLLSAVILFSIIAYKQPFPYNMPATFPAFFVLYAALFSWLHAVFCSRSLKIIFPGKMALLSFLYVYGLSLLYLIHYFSLPLTNIFICLIPAALAVRIITPECRQGLLHIVMSITMIMGVALPAYLFSKLIPDMNGQYQKYILNLSDIILANGGDYVAGVPLFYNRKLSIPGLKHIVVPSLNYLYHPSEKLRPVMNLPSLYLTPTTSEQIIDALKSSSVKLYVNNERLEKIPTVIKNYLATEYQHYWGSIYLYAPTVAAGTRTVNIKFSGRYTVNSKSTVILNSTRMQPGSVAFLDAKQYLSNASETYRLALTPAINQELLKSEYRNDDWEKTLE